MINLELERECVDQPNEYEVEYGWLHYIIIVLGLEEVEVDEDHLIQQYFQFLSSQVIQELTLMTMLRKELNREGTVQGGKIF